MWLSKSDNYCIETLDRYQQNKYEMKPLPSDSALYGIHENNKVIGVAESYPDNVIKTGTEIFWKVLVKLKRIF